MILINLQNATARELHLATGRARARKHRRDNLDHVRELDRARAKVKRPEKLVAHKRFRERRTEEASRLKHRPCMDCGGKFPPCAMDWDHREGEIKIDGPARLAVRKRGMHEVEIEKCDLVCSNCHRIRTATRLGSPTATPWHEEGNEQ